MENGNNKTMGSPLLGGGDMVVVMANGYPLPMEMSKWLFMSEYIGSLFEQVEAGLCLYQEIYDSREDTTFSNWLLTMNSDMVEHIRYLYDEITNPFGYNFVLSELLDEVAKNIGCVKAEMLIKDSKLLCSAIYSKVVEFMERKPEDNEKAA